VVNFTIVVASNYTNPTITGCHWDHHWFHTFSDYWFGELQGTVTATVIPTLPRQSRLERYHFGESRIPVRNIRFSGYFTIVVARTIPTRLSLVATGTITGSTLSVTIGSANCTGTVTATAPGISFVKKDSVCSF